MKIAISLKKIIFFIIMFLIILIILFCLSKIINWFNDNKRIEKLVTNIEKQIDINSSDKKSIINENISKTDQYNDFVNIYPTDINFNNLKKMNNETIGWLQVKMTNVNYPVVQTDNNIYYLNHAFDKSKNNAGWVFMDYRNNYIDIDQNIIIYSNGRLNQTMFGSLSNVLKRTWLNNPNNYIINFSTEKYNSLWQIFSIYKTKNNSDYLSLTFSNTDINKLKKKSVYDFKTNVDSSNKIITLSTCFNNNKLVIHAKLIKIENKK